MVGVVFLFGVELEFLLAPKPPASFLNWATAMQSLSQLLSANSVPNAIVDGDGGNDFSKWVLAPDSSITRDHQAQKWGVALISNICTNKVIEDPQNLRDWEAIQRQLWQTLETSWTIIPSASCGTHVHISMGKTRRGWGLKKLKKVAKAVVYFERCIDSLMPSDRHCRLHNPFCRSNRYNINLREKTMVEIFKDIDNIESGVHGTEGHIAIANLLCPDNRFYRWNFVAFTKDAYRSRPNIRTIEFRQPPGSLSVEEAVFWPRFALAFVAVALRIKPEKPPTRHVQLDPERVPTLDDFRRYIRVGALFADGADREVLDNFFGGKRMLPEGRYPEGYADEASSPAETDQTNRRMRSRDALRQERVDSALPFPVHDSQDSEELDEEDS